MVGKWPPMVDSTCGPLRRGDLKLKLPLMMISEATVGMKEREEGDGFLMDFGLMFFGFQPV